MTLGSTASILRNTLRYANESSSGSSQFHNAALEEIDRIYLQILSGGNEFDVDLAIPWRWAKAKAPLLGTLVPKYETGTVQLTKGSTSGVFSVPPTDDTFTNSEGWRLQVKNRPDIFGITWTFGAAAFTLDAEYTGDTGAALEFMIFKVSYQIYLGTDPTFKPILRLISPIRVHRSQNVKQKDQGKIVQIGFSEFQNDFPLRATAEGTPTHYMVEHEDPSADPGLTIRFNKYPNENTRMEMDYIRVPEPLIDSDTSYPKIPRQFRQVLAYGAASMILALKEDNGSAVYMKLAQNTMRAMVNANRKELQQASSNRCQISPRPVRTQRQGNYFSDPYGN